MPAPINFLPCRGLDVRAGAADDLGYLSHGRNLRINAAGVPVRRPALRVRFQLPGTSFGLYSVGDNLRSAFRSADGLTGGDLTGLGPVMQGDVLFDPSGGNPVVAFLGQVAGSDGKSMILVRRQDGATELHHCGEPNAIPLAPTTVGGLGFAPVQSLTRAAGRAWTLDANDRYLRYSEVDAADPARLDHWNPSDLADGAGFVQAAQFVAGAGAPQALANFGGRLAVFYRSAILLYRIDVDQARFFMDQVITGPGTSAPRSIADLGNDTMFLSAAGPRLLSVIQATKDAGEDALGARVDDLAQSLADQVGVVPVGHYARRLGCYLLAFGQEVLCLSLTPGRPLGWTSWHVPVPVDAWADAGNTTYLRSGNTVYELSEVSNDDEPTLGTFQAIPVLYEHLPMRSPAGVVVEAVTTVSPEAVRVQAVVDAKPPLDTGFTPVGSLKVMPGRAPATVRAVVGKYGRTATVRVYDPDADAGWRLDGLWMEASPVQT